MKVVAIGLTKNEADVVSETVTAALQWVDEFVIYDNSTDATPSLAEQAGAIVLAGPPEEMFKEQLRQHTLVAAADLHPDWIVRIDAGEIYHHDPDPRQVLEEALADGAFCVRGMQMEFWLTLDDVRRGLLLEDERVSIQKRRRWYTAGHMALIAWRHRDDLAFYPPEVQGRANVPLDAGGRNVAQLGPVFGQCPVQKHYNCRSLPQLLARMKDRSSDLYSFGKYRYNLIVDEKVMRLHYLGPDEVFCFKDNHEQAYQWYKQSTEMLKGRAEVFGWNR